MKNKFGILTGLMVLLILILSFGWSTAAQTTDGYTITWWTIDGGGGTSTTSGYTLSGSIGQPIVGEISGGGYTLTSGFWAGVPDSSVQFFQIYLPLLTR